MFAAGVCLKAAGDGLYMYIQNSIRCLMNSQAIGVVNIVSFAFELIFICVYSHFIDDHLVFMGIYNYGSNSKFSVHVLWNFLIWDYELLIKILILHNLGTVTSRCALFCEFCFFLM